MGRIGGMLSDPMNSGGITSRWMSYLQHIDSSLPNQVRLTLWDMTTCTLWLKYLSSQCCRSKKRSGAKESLLQMHVWSD